MSETLTVVHISRSMRQCKTIEGLLDTHRRFKLMTQLDSMNDALIFCPSATPSLIIIHAQLQDNVFLGLLENLRERCPSSILISYGQMPENYMEDMKLAGLDYYVGQFLNSDFILNLLRFAEQKKLSWD